jgi:hypothetical protein
MDHDRSGTSNRPDLVEELVEFLTPRLFDVLERIDADEFTTVQFIDVLQTDPAAKAAYDESLRRWGDDEAYSKMVVHGQVIPAILRRSDRVEWAGFAHGEPDPYAVPAWWRVK